MDEVVVLVVTESPEEPDTDAEAVAAEIWVRLEGMVPVRVQFVAPESVDPDGLVTFGESR